VWDCSLASPPSHSHSASDTGREATLDLDKEAIEIDHDRRRLESLKNVVVHTQELYARCEVTMQESQELLQQVDELLMRSHTKASRAEIGHWDRKYDTGITGIGCEGARNRANVRDLPQRIFSRQFSA